MLRRDLIKNKIYGMVFIVLGALTIPIEWDATFFLFTLMLGILLFVSRENCIMNYYRSGLDFGAETMQWFKRTAKSLKYH